MSKHTTYSSIRERKIGKKTTQSVVYFCYCRKSSEEDTGKQMLSLARQSSWAEREAPRRKDVLKEYFNEEKSATTPFQRPKFDEMVKRIKRGEATGIYTWKLDRLARNPEEAGIVMGMLKRGEIQHIVTSQRDYRPEDNAIISYVDFSLADQYVRDLSTNVYDGLHNKARLGWYPSGAPLGYVNTKYAERGSNIILNDPDRFDTVSKAWQLMLTGNFSVPQIMKIANEKWLLTTRATKTRPEKPVSRSHWYRIFTHPFYCGWYDYPRESGNWHQGKHQPMITEGEFDRVQLLLGEKGRPRRTKREHAYRGLFRCGSCPAMVTAENKIKRQKNGNVHFYTYYRCTKRIRKDCPERAIEIKELERQILDVVRTVTISDQFLKWAMFYLDMTKANDGKKLRSIRETKRKMLQKIERQLENLTLKFTAPENADGELLTDEEYLELKYRFQKRKIAIEREIDRPSEENIGEAYEKIKDAFELARCAQTRFSAGGLENKRNVLARVGSDRRLKRKKVLINIAEPLKAISKKRERVEKEISRVRTAKYVGNKRHLGEVIPKCRTLCGVVDDVRTYFLERITSR